jgi:hypothetical protein
LECGCTDDAGKTQRCWAQLLRDLQHLKQAHRVGCGGAGLGASGAGDLRCSSGRAFGARTCAPAEREAQDVFLTSQRHALGLRYARACAQPSQALAKRLLRHADEVFQFVRIDGLRADNTLADRAIRPLVVIGTVSGGSRSAAGTKTRTALASLLHTWQARGHNRVDQCLALLSQLAAPTAESRVPRS